MQSVDRPWWREATPQSARDPGEVAASQLGLAQAERLDEQHSVVLCQTRHQMVLIGPQLGIPVGESDTHDVSAAQGSRVGHPRHDPRWAGR